MERAAQRDIVIATDGSESAERGVPVGARLASAPGGRAVLVYVRPPIGALGKPYYQEKLSEQMEHARFAIERARRAAEAEDVECEEEILEGEAADAIVEVAAYGTRR